MSATSRTNLGRLIRWPFVALFAAVLIAASVVIFLTQTGETCDPHPGWAEHRMDIDRCGNRLNNL